MHVGRPATLRTTADTILIDHSLPGSLSLGQVLSRWPHSQRGGRGGGAGEGEQGTDRQTLSAPQSAEPPPAAPSRALTSPGTWSNAPHLPSEHRTVSLLSLEAQLFPPIKFNSQVAFRDQREVGSAPGTPPTQRPPEAPAPPCPLPRRVWEAGGRTSSP